MDSFTLITLLLNGAYGFWSPIYSSSFSNTSNFGFMAGNVSNHVIGNYEVTVSEYSNVLFTHQIQKILLNTLAPCSQLFLSKYSICFLRKAIFSVI